MAEPHSSKSSSILLDAILPHLSLLPSSRLTLQLIDAAVVDTVSRFPLQLLQMLLGLTCGAPRKVLHRLIELPQQVAEVVSHRCEQETRQ